MKNEQVVDSLLERSREYFEGTTAEPVLVRLHEVASESPDELDEARRP